MRRLLHCHLLFMHAGLVLACATAAAEDPRPQAARRGTTQLVFVGEVEQLAPVVPKNTPSGPLPLMGPERPAPQPNPGQILRELREPPTILPTAGQLPIGPIDPGAAETNDILSGPNLDDLFLAPPDTTPRGTPLGPVPGTPLGPAPARPTRPSPLDPRPPTPGSVPALPPPGGPTIELPGQPSVPTDRPTPGATSPSTPAPGSQEQPGRFPPGFDPADPFRDIDPFRDGAPASPDRNGSDTSQPFPTPFGDPFTGQVGADPTTADIADLGRELASAQTDTSTTALASIPNVIGDFFDGGTRVVTVRNTVASAFFTNGQRIATSPDVFAFESDGVGFPDDFFTVGQGMDTNGDGLTDTYAISEPLPPNDVPTSPGSQFTFDGGTVVFTNSASSTTPPANVPIPVNGTSVWFASYSFSEPITTLIPAAGGGVAVRRFKIAENNSPIPQDRVFFNYNFFNDVQGGIGDVSRYTLGFEKTHFQGLASWELRLAFAGTLDHDQTVEAEGLRGFEFGNLMFLWKGLFLQTDISAWTAGVGITVPTASDSGLFLPNSQRVLQIRNDAVHVLPYAAWSRILGQRGFVESFLQLDVDTNGNAVYANTPGSGVGGFPRIGTLNDATILFSDTTLGYWVYQDDSAEWLNGLATVAELHYATTLNDADLVSGNGVLVSDTSTRINVLNLTLGTHLKIRSKGRVAVGASIPLRTDDDEPFDYEVLVQANRLF